MQTPPRLLTIADFPARAPDQITTPQVRTRKPQCSTPFRLIGLVPRSRLPIFHVVVFAVLILWPVFGARGQSATGSVEGRVFDARDGTALVNARVHLEGTTLEVVTDDSGSFRLAGVPAGPARLRVSYLGSNPQTESVNVPPGGVTTREFQLASAGTANSEVVRMSAFTVETDREASARAMAMNDRRQAANIQDVVALDEYGDRKGSIGQFIGFLPGVSLNFAGANPTDASLRGFPADFTDFAVDGAPMSSTFAEGRGQRLEEVSSVNISRVEVTKIPTPDMPASGLGGSINLVSRSAFESKHRKISYDLYGMYHSWQGLTLDGGARGDSPLTSPRYNQPSFDVAVLQPLSDNLAVTFGYSRYWEHKPAESGTQHTDESPTWDRVRLVQTASQWQSLNQVRIRTSVQAGVDWRLTPRDTLSLQFRYQNPILVTNRNVLGFNYGAGASGGPTFTQGAATAVGTATMNGSGVNNYPETKNQVSNLKYRHQRDLWRFDLGLSYSDSASTKLDIDKGFFSTTPATITNLIIRGDGIPSSGGTIPTSYSATTRTAPVDLYDGGNYSINSGTSNQVYTNMRRKMGRFDVTRSFPQSIPLTLKAGVAVDGSDRDNRQDQYTWNFQPNGATDATSRLASKFDVFDDAFNATSPTLFGQRVRWFSGSKLYDLYRQHPAWFVANEALTHQNRVSSTREMTETVSAAYLRVDLRLLENRLWIVAGGRFERTEMKGHGPLNDINALYQTDAAGNFVLRNGQRVLITTDPLEQAKLRYQELGAQGGQSYSGFYPSLNTTYNITDKLLVRGAYAQTVGRPQVGNIIPGTTITAPDVANPTITVSNTGLKPWTARSYDLSLESYQIKDGVGSVGVFYKDIKDFFGQMNSQATPDLLARYGLPNDPDFQNYQISTLVNSGNASIKGMEFSYRQSLTFLPAWAKGVQVFVNATKLELGGSNTADFAGYSPKTYAGGISLVRPRYFVKLTYNYQGETRTGSVATSATVPPDTSNYQGEKKRLGINARYSFSRRYSAYLSIVDVLGYEQLQKRYAPGTPEYAKPTRLQELGYFTTVGVRGEF